MAVPVCAFAGTYIGMGLGWVTGQIVDFIPLVNQVAPWIAERCGELGAGMSRHDMNVEYYQLSGAIGGFWGGIGVGVQAGLLGLMYDN